MDEPPTAGPAPAPADQLRPPSDTSGPVRPHGFEAAKLHATLLAVLVLCALAFRFELTRALGGNGLSWAYVFEWPLFAAFGAYMWWTVLHGGRGRSPGRIRRSRAARPTPDGLDPKYAGMLEAWQAHQRDLQASQAAAEGRDVSGPETGL